MAGLSIKHAHTRVCPLCSKLLQTFWNGSVRKFFCKEVFFRNESDWSERVTYERPTRASGFKVPEPHYSIFYRADGTYVQSCIIPPYWIRSFSEEGKSKIYKFPFPSAYVWPPNDNHNLIMEVPIIEPSSYTPDQFKQKIKNLVIFT
jgi:hypothetical protein